MRGSKGCNKRLPPLKYTDLDNTVLSLSFAMNNDHKSLNGSMSALGKVNMKSVVVPAMVIHIKSAKVSYRTKNSSVFRLNLEVSLRKKQEELGDKESRGKLKERKREYLMKEAELKFKIAEKKESIVLLKTMKCSLQLQIIFMEMSSA